MFWTTWSWVIQLWNDKAHQLTDNRRHLLHLITICGSTHDKLKVNNYRSSIKWTTDSNDSNLQLLYHNGLYDNRLLNKILSIFTCFINADLYLFSTLQGTPWVTQTTWYKLEKNITPKRGIILDLHEVYLRGTHLSFQSPAANTHDQTTLKFWLLV